MGQKKVANSWCQNERFNVLLEVHLIIVVQLFNVCLLNVDLVLK